KLTLKRHSAFLLATPWPIDGWYGSASPRCTSMPMPKHSSGCAGASTQTEILPTHISISRLRWRGSGSSTKQAPRCKRDLRSIRASPSVAFVMPLMHGATIRPSLLGATAGLRACAWREYQRGNVGEGSFTSFPPSRRPVHPQVPTFGQLLAAVSAAMRRLVPKSGWMAFDGKKGFDMARGKQLAPLVDPRHLGRPPPPPPSSSSPPPSSFRD